MSNLEWTLGDKEVVSTCIQILIDSINIQVSYIAMFMPPIAPSKIWSTKIYSFSVKYLGG